MRGLHVETQENILFLEPIWNIRTNLSSSAHGTVGRATSTVVLLDMTGKLSIYSLFCQDIPQLLPTCPDGATGLAAKYGQTSPPTLELAQN